MPNQSSQFHVFDGQFVVERCFTAEGDELLTLEASERIELFATRRTNNRRGEIARLQNKIFVTVGFLSSGDEMLEGRVIGLTHLSGD